MKWIFYLVLAALVCGSWWMYVDKGKDIVRMGQEIEAIENAGDLDGKVGEMKTERDGIEGEQTFTGILLTFLSAGVVGIFFVVYLLPFFAQRLTHAVYDSAEQVEKDQMYHARSLIAQGDYANAIEALKEAAAADPLNRLPWVEITKIFKENLDDPQSAIQTIRYALESQEWEMNDAAYFLFRLAELYDEVNGDRAGAITFLNQVIEQFPQTRHSANALHRLHEWQSGADPNSLTPGFDGSAAHQEVAQTALEDEEAEFLEQLRKKDEAAN